MHKGSCLCGSVQDEIARELGEFGYARLNQLYGIP